MQINLEDFMKACIVTMADLQLDFEKAKDQEDDELITMINEEISAVTAIMKVFKNLDKMKGNEVEN